MLLNKTEDLIATKAFVSPVLSITNLSEATVCSTLSKSKYFSDVAEINGGLGILNFLCTVG